MEFKFKKKYGQNFLTQQSITKKIAMVVKDQNDSLAIEVGCGDGRLTKELCKIYTHVLGYEIDKEVIPFLMTNLKQYKNCAIICEDFLNSNLKKDISQYKYKKLYIFGNLPYYITTPIIEHIIDSKMPIDEMVFMVQKEMGDRLCAKVGTKEYSSLTVYLNYYYKIKKEFLVSRNNFEPKPNVDSVVVSFEKYDRKKTAINEEIFFKLVKDCFTYKRKTLKNNLEGYDLDKVLEILQKYNFDLSVRAEKLPLEVFIDIANNLI